MRSRFHEMLDRYVEPHVDEHHGEKFKLTPWLTTPNGRGAQDPARTIIEGVGVLEYESGEQGIQLGVRKTYREANDLRAIPLGRHPILIVQSKFFPTPDVEPRQGDLIEMVEAPELPLFDVVSAQRDGLTRIEIFLVHRGTQA